MNSPVQDDAWPASAFWDWSLTVYARPGVAPACLALQDRCGLDVNLLLFAVWAGTQGRVLPPEAMRAAVERVRRWHADVVRPLRTLRRRLKGDPHGLDPGLAAEVRRRIAAVELDAEHAEQLALTACAEAGAPAVPADAVPANLAAFAASTGLVWSAADRLDLEVIVAAVAPASALPPCPSRPS